MLSLSYNYFTKEPALIKRLVTYGILTVKNATRPTLENVLTLTLEDFLNRRLASVVAITKKAKNFHMARCLVNEGHICMNNYVSKTPNALVKIDTFVDFYQGSNLVQKKPSRRARKTLAKKANAEE